MPRKRKTAETEQDASSSVTQSGAVEEPADQKKQQLERQQYPFEPYPASKAYRLVEPGPVLLVSTGSLADSTHNLMTIGFHMVIQHESPALIGVSIGPWDASFATLKSRRQCVLAVPAVEMAPDVVDIGNCSADDGVDKWARFDLEPLPAEKVEAPLVGGEHVIANIECVVEDTRMVSKYSMWVLKVVKAWVVEARMKTAKTFHHRGDGIFAVDGDVLNLQERMTKWKQFQD